MEGTLQGSRSYISLCKGVGVITTDPTDRTDLTKDQIDLPDQEANDQLAADTDATPPEND